MKKKKPGAFIPIYAFAAAWIVCAFFIPMYTLAGLVGSAAVSAAAAVLAYYTAGMILARRPAKPEPEPEPVKKEEPKLSPEVQAIIDDGKRAMKEMGRLYSSIKSSDVRRRINELMRISDKIVQDAVDDPSDVPQIRKFLDYYLPTTIKLLNAYDRMSGAGVSGENIDTTLAKVEGMMRTIVAAFEKQLDSLYGAEALDISTDITVLENMMAREGLSDDPIHQTREETPAAEEKESGEDGDGIRLEL